MYKPLPLLGGGVWGGGSVTRRDGGEHGQAGAGFQVFAAAHDGAFQILQHEGDDAADEYPGDQADQRIDARVGAGEHGDRAVLQAGFDAVFAARLLILIVPIEHEQLRPFGGDALGLGGAVVFGVKLDDQAVEVGGDADIGAQLLGRHIHLQAVDDFGGAQGAIEPGDMAVEGLLGGLGQAEIAAAGHDEHLLRGAVDGVHAAAEDESGESGDEAEQEHDPAAADEDVGVVDEVHGVILPPSTPSSQRDFTTEAQRTQRFFRRLLLTGLGGATILDANERGSMAATADIRFKRMQGKYQVLQDAQDEVFDKVDSLEAALLGLTEAVSHNSEQIQALAEAVVQNGERITALERRVDVIDDKLDAIMKHLEVPYKPPAGFVKD